MPFSIPTDSLTLFQDSAGKSALVWFLSADSPGPHFRPEDLQQGHFLCVRDAAIVLFPTSDVHDVRVKDFGSARIFTVRRWVASVHQLKQEQTNKQTKTT